MLESAINWKILAVFVLLVMSCRSRPFVWHYLTSCVRTRISCSVSLSSSLYFKHISSLIQDVVMSREGLTLVGLVSDCSFVSGCVVWFECLRWNLWQWTIFWIWFVVKKMRVTNLCGCFYPCRWPLLLCKTGIQIRQALLIMFRRSVIYS